MKTFFKIASWINLLIFVSAAFPQGTWKQMKDFPAYGRPQAVGFSIGTKGYIGTGDPGNGGHSYFNDFWEWDLETNEWTKKADFGGGERSFAVGFAIGKMGYIGTGRGPNSYGSFNDFWEYNPGNDSWTQKANLPGAIRNQAVGFSIGNKGYISLGAGASQDLWEWDQPSNTWNQKANFPGASRTDAVGFSIGNKGYIGTGAYVNGYTNQFWEWDQATNSWSKKADFPGIPRNDGTGFSIGKKGYIGTGAYYGGRDFWEWDQVTNTWLQQTDVGGINGRAGAVGFSIQDKGYIFSGMYNDFWEFTSGETMGTNTINSNSEIKIFPNPARTTFTIDFADKRSSFFRIKNPAGQIVFENNEFSGEVTIDFSNQSRGIYFAEIFINSIPDNQPQKIVKKIVIE